MGFLFDPLWSSRRSCEEFAQRAANAKRSSLTAIIAACPEAGGLLSYGPCLLENMRQVAEMVDRIAKGNPSCCALTA